jgi:hypothetical protein
MDAPGGQIRHRIHAPQFLDRPYQARRAPFLEANASRPCGLQDLFLGAHRPNGVNSVP